MDKLKLAIAEAGLLKKPEGLLQRSLINNLARMG